MKTLATGFTTLGLLIVAAVATPAPAETTLADGSSVLLIGRASSRRYFDVDVPRFTSQLLITTSGGRGDLDLYARWGSAPTPAGYHHRSAGRDNNERIAVLDPRPGRWRILVAGYRPYFGARLTVRIVGNRDGAVRPPKDNKYDLPHRSNRHARLTPGDPIRGLSGYRGSERTYRLLVPQGTELLAIGTGGGEGDPDLFVRRGDSSTTRRFDYKSDESGTRERIRIRRPHAGLWYVTVRGYRSYRDVTLAAVLDRDEAGNGFHRGRRGRHRRRPVARLLTPDAGDTWYLGSSYTVTWQASRGVEAVQAQYSLDDGRTWRRSAAMPASIDADVGRLTVRLPGDAEFLLTTQARVRLIDTTTGRVLDEAGPFAIERRPRVGRRPWPGHWGRGDDRRDRHRRPTVGRPPRKRRDAFEPDDSFRRPSSLTIDRTQYRTINPGGETDYVQLVPPGAGTYRISIREPRTDLEVELYEVRRGGTLRRLDDFEVEEEGRTVTATATGATRGLLLRIRAEDDDEVGTYEISASRR